MECGQGSHPDLVSDGVLWYGLGLLWERLRCIRLSFSHRSNEAKSNERMVINLKLICTIRTEDGKKVAEWDVELTDKNKLIFMPGGAAIKNEIKKNLGR